MPPPENFPLRWESTGDQWWYASPIDYAAANGHYDLVRELLRLDGNHLIKLTSLRRIRRLETVWDGDEEQFHDVAKCRSKIARKLLSECDTKQGKNSLIGSGYGGWLLYTAASAGDLNFVGELLERDPLLVFGEGEYGVTDILYAAARSKNCEVFRVVLDFTTEPKFGSGGEKHFGEIPLAYKFEIMNRAIHAAARGGNLKLLKELIEGCSDDVLAYKDSRGATILHAAAARGQVEIIKYITKNFDIINSTDHHGNTALHMAAHRGQLPAVEALILASPSSITATNNAGETFLHAVVAGFQTPGFRRLDRQIELVKHLLSGHIFDIQEIINAKNHEGRTALHLAIIGNVHYTLVELLMTVKYIDVNIHDTNRMTPLDILKKRPRSASSELLTRQLISAGGIFTSRDDSTRRVIASHIKKQSIGNSPGTSFRINDIEIFLHTGIENAPDEIRGPGLNIFSTQNESSMDNYTPPPKPVNHTAERLKRLLHWPKTKKRLKKSVDGNLEAIPIPLRQRFLKPSSIPNNKRAHSVRSNQPSPMAKKKLASGMIHGVMQAVPHFKPHHRSRSSSFSKFSFSSQSSLDAQKGRQIENEIAKCSNLVSDDGTRNSISRHGLVSKRLLMNQYLCFGGSGRPKEGGPGAGLQTYEVYERSVLSAA